MKTFLAALALIAPLVFTEPAHADTAVIAPDDADAPLVLCAALEVPACVADLVEAPAVVPALELEQAPAPTPELQQNGVRLPGNLAELDTAPLQTAGLDDKAIEAIAAAAVPIVMGFFGWAYAKVVKKKERRAQINEYAGDAYHCAETLGYLEKLRGHEKLGKYFTLVEDALDAEQAPKLTLAERGRLEQKARRLAMITKPKPTNLPLKA